jgi:chromosome segregation ATPase
MQEKINSAEEGKKPPAAIIEKFESQLKVDQSEFDKLSETLTNMRLSMTPKQNVMFYTDKLAALQKEKQKEMDQYKKFEPKDEKEKEKINKKTQEKLDEIKKNISEIDVQIKETEEKLEQAKKTLA